MATRPADGVTRRRFDDEWGRAPGRRPPLPAWAPLTWLVALAGVLTFVVVALVRPPGPLDDADPAYQRDGLLLSGPAVPQEVLGVEFGRQPVVLLFVREAPGPGRLQQWAESVPERASSYIVLPEPIAADLPLPTVVDPLNRLVDIVDMPRPVDGGPPVGYAVVDSDRLVRYATLDPEYLTNAFEVATIAGAVR